MQMTCDRSRQATDDAEPPDAVGRKLHPDGFHVDSDFVRIALGATRLDVRRAEFWPLMELMSAAALRLAEVQVVERRQRGSDDSTQARVLWETGREKENTK